jgi:hypothetical protein
MNQELIALLAALEALTKRKAAAYSVEELERWWNL